MIDRGDQGRLQSLTTNSTNSWKPKETVIPPEGFLTESYTGLKTSDKLQFLQEEKENKTEKIFEDQFWDLNDEKGKITPLKFSNGKTQTDVVKEITDLIKAGTKIIFLHGACGTGKCLDKETLIFCKPSGNEYFGYHKISEIVGKEGEIISLDEKGNLVKSKFKNVRATGNKQLYKQAER